MLFSCRSMLSCICEPKTPPLVDAAELCAPAPALALPSRRGANIVAATPQAGEIGTPPAAVVAVAAVAVAVAVVAAVVVVAVAVVAVVAVVAAAAAAIINSLI